jgi:hypothetical protein
MDFNGRHFGSSRPNGESVPLQWPSSRFGDFDRPQLAGRLERLADVRSSVVARGRALIANPLYPSREIVEQISRLLAKHIQR